MKTKKTAKLGVESLEDRSTPVSLNFVTFPPVPDFIPPARTGVVRSLTTDASRAAVRKASGLSVQGAKVSGAPAQNIQLRALVTQNGQPIKGQMVVFSMGEKELGTGETNRKGVANAKYTIPKDARIGDSIRYEVAVGSAKGIGYITVKR